MQRSSLPEIHACFYSPSRLSSLITATSLIKTTTQPFSQVSFVFHFDGENARKRRRKGVREKSPSGQRESTVSGLSIKFSRLIQTFSSPAKIKKLKEEEEIPQLFSPRPQQCAKQCELFSYSFFLPNHDERVRNKRFSEDETSFSEQHCKPERRMRMINAFQLLCKKRHPRRRSCL